MLWAINSAGVGKSDPHLVRMPGHVPSQIPSLDVRVTGSNTLQAFWSVEPDGVDIPETYSYFVVVYPDYAAGDDKSRGRRRRSLDGELGRVYSGAVLILLVMLCYVTVSSLPSTRIVIAIPIYKFLHLWCLPDVQNCRFSLPVSFASLIQH